MVYSIPCGSGILMVLSTHIYNFMRSLTMDIKKLYKQVAKKRGVPVSQVRAEMRKAVSLANAHQGGEPSAPTDAQVAAFLITALNKAKER